MKMSEYKDGPMSLVEGAKISKGNVSTEAEATGLSATEATVTMTNRMNTSGSVDHQTTEVENLPDRESNEEQKETNIHEQTLVSNVEIDIPAVEEGNSENVESAEHNKNVENSKLRKSSDSKIDKPTSVEVENKNNESEENMSNTENSDNPNISLDLKKNDKQTSDEAENNADEPDLKRQKLNKKVSDKKSNKKSATKEAAPVTKEIFLFLPNSAYDKTDKILIFLKHQNNINVDKWRILQRTNENSHALIKFLIDQESAERLKEKKCLLYYRFRQIKVEIY